LFFLQSLSYALSEATSYKVTVQSLQLKSATTNQWITIATPNQEINLRDAAAGGIAASLLSDVAIPVGTYDNFKLVLSETMTVQGSDGGQSSASGGIVTLTGADACVASTFLWTTAANCTDGGGFTDHVEIHETVNSVAGTSGEITFTLNLNPGDGDNSIDIYSTSDLGTPIEVTPSSVISMWFDFDTQSTVLYVGAINTDIGADGGFAYFPPSTGTQFSITVDGTTTLITAANMRLDF